MKLGRGNPRLSPVILISICYMILSAVERLLFSALTALFNSFVAHRVSGNKARECQEEFLM